MQPWPTAYTFLRRGTKTPVRVLLTRAVPSAVRPNLATVPGTLFTDPAFPQALLVSAGSGERSVVEVRELQPAGKRAMAAAEFLRGHPPQPGDHFGPESP
jgi:methionyl-tRNA formyltransferase